MLQKTDVITKLKDLIEQTNNTVIADVNEELDIDSFTMMLIITYSKEELGIELDLDRIDFDAFKSLGVLADIVLAHAESTAA